jgi:hypothetical protein
MKGDECESSSIIKVYVSIRLMVYGETERNFVLLRLDVIV